MTFAWRSPSDSVQIVDARSADRFAGKAPEPRPGLRSGHMPRAFNVPYDRLLENGRLASRERVDAAFTSAGVDLDKPIITSCGSGVTAAILTFALDSIGKEPKGLYDGSWAEWGVAARSAGRARQIKMHMPKTKPVALVTGGAKGIGRAMARHLLSPAGKLASSIFRAAACAAPYPPRHRSVYCRGGRRARRRNRFRHGRRDSSSRFGRLDGVVSNAGIMIRKPLRRLTLSRMAPRHRHQSDGRVPVGARRRKAAAQGARRYRHHRLDPRADVGAQYRILFGSRKADLLRSPTRSPSALARMCG